MQFKDIIGFDEIKDHWRKISDSGHIPHALLLDCPDGMPALHLAWAWAQYLNCTNKQNGDSCGTCPSCKKSDLFVHPDILWTFPVVNASQEQDPCAKFMDLWREFMDKEKPYPISSQWNLQLSSKNSQPTIYVKAVETIIENLSMRIAEGGYRIHIIYQPEKMNDASSNKLLKHLEEPPEKTIFLLVSLHPDLLLDTITSRVQRVEFPLMSQDLMAQVAEKYSLLNPSISLDDAIDYAAGNPGVLVQYFNNNRLFKEQEQEAYTWLKYVLNRDIVKTKTLIENISFESREYIVTILSIILRYTRDILFRKITQQNEEIASPTPVEELEVLMDPSLAGIIYASTESAIRDIKGNVTAKLVLFDLSISWMMAFSQKIRSRNQS